MTRRARSLSPLARLARLWTVFRSGRWLEAGQYRANYRRMDRIYLLEDPWNLTSPREKARFSLVNATISSVAPDCGMLLELGSGEGIQTAILLDVARQVTGLEVSSVAVERARASVPCAEFITGRAEDAASLLAGRRFDLITACEILYYAQDVEGILAGLRSLAPMILVINYERRAHLLAHHFMRSGWVRLDDLASHGMRWHCHLWRAPALSVRRELSEPTPGGRT
ncbi:MAG: SAM-dependent methyltransferase [Novosphingobium sp.]